MGYLSPCTTARSRVEDVGRVLVWTQGATSVYVPLTDGMRQLCRANYPKSQSNGDMDYLRSRGQGTLVTTMVRDQR